MVRRLGIVIILFLMGLSATSTLALEEKPDIWAPSESPWLHATRETIRLRMKSFATANSDSDERRGTFQKDRTGDIHVVSEFESGTGKEFAQGLVVDERALLLEQGDNLDRALEARAAALALLHLFYPGGAQGIPLNADILTLREDHTSFYAFYRSASLFQPSGGNACFRPPWTVTGKVIQVDPQKISYHFEIQKAEYAAILDGIWEVGALQEGLPDAMLLKEWKIDTIMLPDFEGRMRKSNRLMLAEYPTLGELRRTLETGEPSPPEPGWRREGGRRDR